MKLEACSIQDFCYVPDGLKGEKTRTSLLAFLGIGSAFVDWFDFLWDVTDIKRWGEISTVRIVIEGNALAGILLVSVYAAIFCIKAFREARKEEKEEKRKEKSGKSR